MINTAVVSANLGSFDKPTAHATQSLVADYYNFTDDNFPPRVKTMSPRLQARIPKCFAWQLKPGYEFYVWVDANLIFKHRNSLRYLLTNLEGYDIAALRHPKRPNIRQEARYLRKGVKQQSRYLYGRYAGELPAEQYAVINSDPDYTDDALLMSGVFAYRNTPQVQAALKEWWYHISRFHVVDQLAFVYCLRKAGLKINMLEDIYNDCWWLDVRRHAKGA